MKNLQNYFFPKSLLLAEPVIFDARVTMLFPRYTTTITLGDWPKVYTKAQKLKDEPSQVTGILAGKFLGGSAEL